MFVHDVLKFQKGLPDALQYCTEQIQLNFPGLSLTSVGSRLPSIYCIARLFNRSLEAFSTILKGETIDSEDQKIGLAMHYIDKKAILPSTEISKVLGQAGVTKRFINLVKRRIENPEMEFLVPELKGPEISGPFSVLFEIPRGFGLEAPV